MKNKKNGSAGADFFKTALAVLIIVLVSVITLNIVLIRKTESERIAAEGQMRLSSIAGRVENSLYQSECLLDSVAMKIEQMISSEEDADRLLTEYFCAETVADIGEKSDGSCFSAYAAYNGKLYINDFVPDDDFVLEERTWLVEAKKRMGAVNVTDPYIDASTGQMCYTISKLLPDGKTVVGLDFRLSEIQKYIEEMDSSGTGTSIIVNGKGMIIGHSQPECVGKFCREFEDYSELVNKVYMLYGDSFDYHTDNGKYTIFSERTNYDWYLIVSVRRGMGNSGISGFYYYIIIVMVLFSVAMVVFFIYTYRRKAAAENALFLKEEHIRGMSSELKRPLSQILSKSEMMDSGEGSIVGNDISESAKELERMLDELSSISDADAGTETKTVGKAKKERTVSHKKRIMLITAVLVITSAFAIGLNTDTQVKWGNTKMQKETELYFYQVKDWINNNRAVLDVIADSIAAQPGFGGDYDEAVTYLDSIVSKYDDISVAYLCNPEWEHTVLMNNRWEPDSSWHVEERQWYIDTLMSDNNFNIAAPYLDEQTGLYCTTLSKIVYDSKGDFIGVLGIDYYLDKLIGILGESYTDTGYAFLTDIDGNILNHPYADYQMQPGYSVNAAELCYRTAFYNNEITFIDDYDGRKKVCLAMGEPVSGFTVVAVKNTEEIFGNAVISDAVYLVVFLLCILIISVIMRKLTEWQERVNSELKEAAENAISAGKAKNDFLANMSHEIRTPINAVLGMNEMILRESEDNRILEYSNNIQSAGRTLLSLINDILDFSKIESGKMEIIPVEYNMGQLICELVNMIRTRADKKGLQFITEIDEHIPAELYGDDVRIKQIITNILTNAVKYTQKGNVRLKMHLLEINDGKAKLEVSVTDTGMGIKEEDMSKLFTSFQRLDQEKNRNIEGTGLGITIVQKLLNMMGSELNVASVYGVGSTFSFVITQKVVNSEPMGNFENSVHNVKRNKSDDSLKTAPDARVLIVDDNDTNLLVAKSLLKRTLVKTDTCMSGKECIELIGQNIYDIVFLDHMMPEMDGIETLKKIKDEQLGGATKFVILTANAVQGAKQTYLDAGFDDYLSKPINGHDLEECLFRFLDDSLIVGGKKSKKKREERSAEFLPDISAGLANYGNYPASYMNAVYAFCDNNKCNDLELDFSVKDMGSYHVNLKKVISEADALGLSELKEKALLLEAAVEEKDEKRCSEMHKELISIYKNAADNLEAAAEKRLSERDDIN